MINYFPIPVAKKHFLEELNTKNEKVQLTAHEGLELPFQYTDEEIEDSLI